MLPLKSVDFKVSLGGGGVALTAGVFFFFLQVESVINLCRHIWRKPAVRGGWKILKQQLAFFQTQRACCHRLGPVSGPVPIQMCQRLKYTVGLKPTANVEARFSQLQMGILHQNNTTNTACSAVTAQTHTRRGVFFFLPF